MVAPRTFRFVGVGLLIIGLVFTLFMLDFYYTYCFRVSHALSQYACGSALTIFPQLIASLGLIVVSFVMLITAPAKHKE